MRAKRTRRQSDSDTGPTWTQGRTTEEEGTAGARFQQSRDETAVPIYKEFTVDGSTLDR